MSTLGKKNSEVHRIKEWSGGCWVVGDCGKGNRVLLISGHYTAVRQISSKDLLYKLYLQSTILYCTLKHLLRVDHIFTVCTIKKKKGNRDAMLGQLSLLTWLVWGVARADRVSTCDSVCF